ncbi:RrF2 family transcriptional regulator [Acidovorax sp.]|uniref:RrF2 family transcriptional regulator n=1 Tax=Acidovorax sp. TaxID=1872122 RepID=UPI00391AD032
MRLTQWTDYTLRVLMYCAATEGRAKPVTISEVAEGYGISRSHLMKIVQQLAAQGLLETTRGRGGGMRLMRPAASINVGEVVRATETDFHLVECFDPATDACRLSSHCRLKGVLSQAMDAYLAVLDGVTLAELVPPRALASGISAPEWAPVQAPGLNRQAPGLPVRSDGNR